MTLRAIWLTGFLALLCTACAREDAASYSPDGDQRHSISLLRETYPWSDAWTLKLVTTHSPECLRRHALKDAALKKFQVEVYKPQDNVFILHQGEHWYVTEMGKCQLQEFKDPPPFPGEPVGSFVERKKSLVFIDEAGKATEPVRIVR